MSCLEPSHMGFELWRTRRTRNGEMGTRVSGRKKEATRASGSWRWKGSSRCRSLSFAGSGGLSWGKCRVLRGSSHLSADAVLA